MSATPATPTRPWPMESIETVNSRCSLVETLRCTLCKPPPLSLFLQHGSTSDRSKAHLRGGLDHTVPTSPLPSTQLYQPSSNDSRSTNHSPQSGFFSKPHDVRGRAFLNDPAIEDGIGLVDLCHLHSQRRWTITCIALHSLVLVFAVSVTLLRLTFWCFALSDVAWRALGGLRIFWLFCFCGSWVVVFEGWSIPELYGMRCSLK